MIRHLSGYNALLGLGMSARNRLAMALMLLCALGALSAFGASVGDVLAAGPATQQAEAWRTLGFAFFAAVFVLLAVWPRRYPGLWEIVIVNKAALTIVELALIGNQASNAQSSAIADGVLTALLVAAYVLARGWTSWGTRRLA